MTMGKRSEAARRGGCVPSMTHTGVTNEGFQLNLEGVTSKTTAGLGWGGKQDPGAGVISDEEFLQQ